MKCPEGVPNITLSSKNQLHCWNSSPNLITSLPLKTVVHGPGLFRVVPVALLQLWSVVTPHHCEAPPCVPVLDSPLLPVPHPGLVPWLQTDQEMVSKMTSKRLMKDFKCLAPLAWYIAKPNIVNCIDERLLCGYITFQPEMHDLSKVISAPLNL